MSDEKQPLILAIDHNRRNLELLAKFLGQHGYQVLSATTVQEVEGVLGSLEEINLVMVDISGFDRSIWTLCQRLQEEAIPFLVISPRQNAAIQQTSFAHGAFSMLVKPLVIRDLLQLIHNLLRE